MKILSTSFLLLFIFSAQLLAQEEDLSQQTILSGNTIYTTTSTDFKGSPLIKSSFEKGKIIYNNGTVSKSVPLNYDSYKNQVLFIEDETIKVLNLSNVAAFIFEKNNPEKVQEKFAFDIRVPSLETTAKVPIQVLYNGNTKLLAHHQTRLVKGNSVDPYTGKKTDHYISSINYFIQNPDGEFIKTKMNIRNVIRDLEKKHRKKLKAYVKKNSLKKKSETDIIQLVSYYDGLNE